MLYHIFIILYTLYNIVGRPPHNPVPPPPPPFPGAWRHPNNNNIYIQAESGQTRSKSTQINPNQAKPKLNEAEPKPNQAKTAIMKTISLAKIWQAIRNPWPVAGTKTISLAKIWPAAQNPRPAIPTHNVRAPSYIYIKSKPNQAKPEPNQTKSNQNPSRMKPNPRQIRRTTSCPLAIHIYI